MNTYTNSYLRGYSYKVWPHWISFFAAAALYSAKVRALLFDSPLSLEIKCKFLSRAWCKKHQKYYIWEVLRTSLALNVWVNWFKFKTFRNFFCVRKMHSVFFSWLDVNMLRMEEHEKAVLAVSSNVQWRVLFTIAHVPNNPYYLSFSLLFESNHTDKMTWK